MGNPKKLATQGIQDEDKKNKNKKHNTICVRHDYAQANTNNTHKTPALQQTAGGKDERNIVFMWKESSF
jgi:hypothetical protein